MYPNLHNVNVRNCGFAILVNSSRDFIRPTDSFVALQYQTITQTKRKVEFEIKLK